jgi:signal transduction histidine kinase
MNFLQQVFALLSTPPGNLIYHLVLLFALSFAFGQVWVNWRESRFPQQRRAMGGLLLLLLLQVGLFLISGLGWQGVVNLPVFLPPLQRALSFLMLLWVTWLWLFPEPSTPGDTLTILASLAVAIGALFGLANWGEIPPATPYNHTFQAALWGWVSLFWSLAGLALLILRRPNGWEFGMAFFLLMLSGQVLSLLLEHGGDYAGGIRLAELAAYPLLLALANRFPHQGQQKPLPRPSAATEAGEKPVERRRYSADPKAVHALLELGSDLEGSKLHLAMARAVAQVMLADLCFLVFSGDDGRQIIFAAGYDLIREEPIEGASVPREMAPMLASAVQRGRPLRLPASSTSADVRGLAQLLGLEQIGHLMVVPIQTLEREVLGGLLLLAPYSNRQWTAEDQTFLSNIASDLVPLLQRHRRVLEFQEYQAQVAQLNEKLKGLENERAILQTQIEALKGEIEKARLGEAQAQEQIQELTRLLAESQQALQELRAQNVELEASLQRRGTSEEVRQLERELRNALIEVARLQNQLGESNARILELEDALKHAPSQRFAEQAEVIASTAQELRQPLSSLMGYVDLLLGESVGTLSPMQRKFAERIKASIERLRSLVDDLIQLTLIESGLASQKPQAVDLNKIVDAAISYTSAQMRERNITLHMELPSELPPLYVDPDAIQQILIHLLQNATMASPVEGEIRLRVEMKEENGREFILLQVSDSGGGIPEEDLPRVFTRLYRAENVLIQGVGDTGIGLSLAKSLTESNGGRIWVHSDPGIGATFNVLLPIARL